MVTDAGTWIALAPVVVLAVTSFALFLLDSVNPGKTNNGLLAGLSLAGVLGSLAVTVWYFFTGVGRPEGLSLLGDQVIVDGMSLFFTFIVTSVAALVVLASYDYLHDQPHKGEFYSLIVLAATGMALMANANSLMTVFISLELASLSSYALVAFLKHNRGSVEGGLKYFLIGALSSAIFVYGISLVYATTGSLQLGAVAAGIEETENVGILGVGTLMLVGGFAYKTASVPFHFWAPEAYEGAPAPVSAFISSASKAAGFVIAFRVFVEAFPLDVVAGLGIDWVLIFQVLAVVTMLVGNFAAALQENVKRMLAYSSVGHAGYVLIGLAALGGGNDAAVMGAAMMHLLVYGFMNTGAFLFIALAEYRGVGRTFEDYNGMWRQSPIACAAVTVFLFSLAGLPIGGGFLSKYVLFTAAIGAGYWWLAAVGALASALSLFYYSRLVKAIWIEDPIRELDVSRQPVGLYAAIVAAAVMTVALIPAFPVVDLAQAAAGALLA
ncbi:NADH-quinone oxidoreductase subunit N [Halalkalicoccus jeotgali]|uniref:Proton-translocating NADH-quinone oxidoreductase, chain N n=1 Tax=Halalkalicoccus jeotgali (strain DSM 18796 / CECT 7217 / JCM 14584 / KCTC 4019 / B3) TaxID=795797 RepID=D8J5L6_HALJB|nr:NADH-quinone oxidoreductase subunit N [Halalkalicoccus jeotgali]ADJ15712.1 proton-translocating NADH-quinone oxidoreductase, chain N [Halalkalicoccus jeotgali B3]ELY36518.1 proton-translocating NADH-quinone oxidoreductase, chain N [Halalkalicoccus jeotgali B3]